MSETQVEQTQVGAEQNVPASNGQANGSQEEVANLKDVLGPIFGTEFKTDEDALRSVENAKNMSGKVGQLESQLNALRGQQATPDVTSKISELESQLKQMSFYTSHPEYNTPEAKALIAKMGNNPEAVITDPTFKMAFDAIQKSNELEKSKSVLHSNPRLGQVTDKIGQAKEAAQQARQAAAQGDVSTAAQAYNAAKAAAVSSVLDAYEGQ